MSQSDRETGRKIGPGIIPRPARRLSDKVLIAFYDACALREFAVAWRLLRVLELIITRRIQGPDRRRQHNRETLVAAHEWLWQQRRPDPGPSTKAGPDAETAVAG
jgi:hypothetical protein